MKKKKKEKKNGIKMALNIGGEPVLIGASFKDWLMHLENFNKNKK
jgi:succinyl-CoA synthetase alpha subunit